MKKLVLFLTFCIFFLNSYGQKQQIVDTLSGKELKEYKNQTKEMISFFEYSLNILGSKTATTTDKEVIIYESYKKIFRDSTVQIEDDLDPNRDMPISKNVRAYLKDVVFFYKDVTFDFEITDIEHFINQKHQLTFKVTVNRHLKGTTIEDREVDNNLERHIEINLDKQSRELKIASIYTHNINMREELSRWWSNLSYRWRNILGKKYALNDTLDMSNVTQFNDSLALFYVDTLPVDPDMVYRQVKKITELKELDISGNSGVKTLQGVTKLSDLEKLNCSNTSISSLVPIRNLTNLKHLNCENTGVKTLDPIKFATNITTLYFDNSLLSDISAAKNFAKLQRFYFKDTKVTDLSPLGNLTNLTDLRFANTPVNSLSPIDSLQNLEYLDITATNITRLTPLQNLTKLEHLEAGNTAIDDLGPLSGLDSLRTLFIDHTNANSLTPLVNIPNLSKIYCDQTNITKKEAEKFLDAHPESIVIYNSKALSEWWDNLPRYWKKIFSSHTSVERDPGKAGLHLITQLKEIDASGNSSLRTLKPLTRINTLLKLDVSKTPVKDLTPLKNMVDLRELNCYGTRVKDISPLSNLTNLEKLNLGQTAIQDLSPLSGLQHLNKILAQNTIVDDLTPLKPVSSLRFINCNNTMIGTEEVLTLLEATPECLVLYRSKELKTWWQELPEAWQQIFKRNVKIADNEPSPEKLHKLTATKELTIINNDNIANIAPLTKFINLQKLTLQNTGISDISYLGEIQSLHTLNISKNYEINSLKPLQKLKNLEKLNFSNTAVEELSPLQSMHKLTEINMSGTKVKKLNPLQELGKLKVLDCSNTNIGMFGFLSPLKELENLQTLKCYNSNVPKILVNRFKKHNRGCKVIYY